MDIRRNVRKILSKTIDVAEKVASEGKKQVDLLRLNSQKEELELLLGRKCYELIVQGKDVLEEKSVSEIVSQISIINKQIKKLTENLECKKCGYKILSGVIFCPRCGTKV